MTGTSTQAPASSQDKPGHTYNTHTLSLSQTHPRQTQSNPVGGKKNVKKRILWRRLRASQRVWLSPPGPDESQKEDKPKREAGKKKNTGLNNTPPYWDEPRLFPASAKAGACEENSPAQPLFRSKKKFLRVSQWAVSCSNAGCGMCGIVWTLALSALLLHHGVLHPPRVRKRDRERPRVVSHDKTLGKRKGK